jgi:hypothetical protein
MPEIVIKRDHPCHGMAKIRNAYMIQSDTVINVSSVMATVDFITSVRGVVSGYPSMLDDVIGNDGANARVRGTLLYRAPDRGPAGFGKMKEKDSLHTPLPEPIALSLNRGGTLLSPIACPIVAES